MANGTVKVSQVDVLTTSGIGTISIMILTTNINKTITLPDGFDAGSINIFTSNI